jgi:hypothetical protein
VPLAPRNRRLSLRCAKGSLPQRCSLIARCRWRCHPPSPALKSPLQPRNSGRTTPSRAMQRDVKVFRVAVIPFVVCTATIGVPLGLCVAVARLGSRNIPSLLIGAAGGVLAAFLCAWLVALYFTLKVGPHGVYGHSFWGVRQFVGWQEIADIRTFDFFNLGFLRLYGVGRTRPVWMPLFLARRAECVQELRRVAPPGNPVLAHFHDA